MNENLTLIWENCLQFMRDNLNAAEDNTDLKKLENSFDLLFDNVQPVSLVSNNLTLLVPSDFYKEYIEDNYLSLLSAALKKNIGKGVKLWYSVMENRPAGQEKPITVNFKGKSIPTPKMQETLPPAFSANLINPFVVPGMKKVNIDSNLKADFSFYNLDIFNQSENNNSILMSVDSWSNAHPLLKILPVEWNHRIPFGILHAQKPTEIVQLFLDAVKKVIQI